MKNIAVVYGGYSGETEVSLESVKMIINDMDKSKYIPYKIFIDQTSWHYELENGEKIEIDKNDFSIRLNDKKIKFDIVFIIIHGTPGEDGKLQSYFEMLEIPYTTCSSIVSSITFNKAYCNHIINSYGVKTAPYMHLFKNKNYNTEEIIEECGLPCFVKPAMGGSSIGMSKVKKEEELLPAIEKAYHECDEIMVESFIEGREFTCGLVKHQGQMIVFPITEILSKKEFFDFQAKYNMDFVDEITPADLDEESSNKCKSISAYLYNKLNCKGVVRMDYILNDKDFYFLEVNTVPGMSAESIVPKQACSHGWTNTELINRILETV